ncbi:MAG: CRISPR-associated protein Cas4 [Anaerolineae bacterium UTCFX5]|jgi:CRISPR-associated exonuclease Cas4|nr:MAG: CRISPR-associated protein Cas4 [Anaerolineae bacterium UTCFX5]
MTSLEAAQPFTVTDLKQHIYCQRISYFHLCLPDIRPVTRKMSIGIERHVDERKRAARRTMAMYGLTEGELLFDVDVTSSRLNLVGRLDQLVIAADELIVVDYKVASRHGKHQEVQLAAYAMMAEESYLLPAKRGFIYLTKAKKAVEIRISSQLRKIVESALQEMTVIQQTEWMPQPTEWRQRCLDCEFRRFCNDV